jgi:hypothetical protein
MVTKECFGCEKVTSHEHFHDCAPGNPETHIAGSERFVCVLCGQRGRVAFPFHIRQSGGGTMSRWNRKRCCPPRLFGAIAW